MQAFGSRAFRVKSRGFEKHPDLVVAQRMRREVPPAVDSAVVEQRGLEASMGWDCLAKPRPRIFPLRAPDGALLELHVLRFLRLTALSH